MDPMQILTSEGWRIGSDLGRYQLERPNEVQNRQRMSPGSHNSIENEDFLDVLGVRLISGVF